MSRGQRKKREVRLEWMKKAAHKMTFVRETKVAYSFKKELWKLSLWCGVNFKNKKETRWKKKSLRNFSFSFFFQFITSRPTLFLLFCEYIYKQNKKRSNNNCPAVIFALLINPTELMMSLSSPLLDDEIRQLLNKGFRWHRKDIEARVSEWVNCRWHN